MKPPKGFSEVAKVSPGGVIPVLSVVSLLRGVGASVLMTFLPVYAVLQGLDLPSIGAITAVATALGVALMPVAGFLADSVGRRSLLVLSTVLLASSLALPTVLPGVAGVFTAYSLFHLSLALWFPARSATLAESVERDVMGTSFAAVSLAFQVARAVTPYLAGLVIGSAGYSILFTLSSVVVVVAALILLTMLREGPPTQGSNFSLRDFVRGLIPSKGELSFQVFLCMDRASWRLWFPLLNSYMKAYLGLSEPVIGLVNTLRGAASIAGVLISGRLVDKLGWFPVLVASEVLGVTSALLAAVSRSGVLMGISLAFVGLSVAFWVPSFNVAISSLSPGRSELGRSYARANFYRSVVSIPFPWVGGQLYALIPFLPMAVASVSMVASTAVLASIRGKLGA